VSLIITDTSAAIQWCHSSSRSFSVWLTSQIRQR